MKVIKLLELRIKSSYNFVIVYCWTINRIHPLFTILLHNLKTTFFSKKLWQIQPAFKLWLQYQVEQPQTNKNLLGELPVFLFPSETPRYWVTLLYVKMSQSQDHCFENLIFNITSTCTFNPFPSDHNYHYHYYSNSSQPNVMKSFLQKKQ